VATAPLHVGPRRPEGSGEDQPPVHGLRFAFTSVRPRDVPAADVKRVGWPLVLSSPPRGFLERACISSGGCEHRGVRQLEAHDHNPGRRGGARGAERAHQVVLADDERRSEDDEVPADGERDALGRPRFTRASREGGSAARPKPARAWTVLHQLHDGEQGRARRARRRSRAARLHWPQRRHHCARRAPRERSTRPARPRRPGGPRGPGAQASGWPQ